jgi:hypothetical protein
MANAALHLDRDRFVHAIANHLAEKDFPAVFCHIEVPHT